MMELLPCPFCSSFLPCMTSNGTENYYVECTDCGASGPPDDDDIAAANKWNTRPKEPQ